MRSCSSEFNDHGGDSRGASNDFVLGSNLCLLGMDTVSIVDGLDSWSLKTCMSL